jgi:putative intracellular protease/amidase
MKHVFCLCLLALLSVQAMSQPIGQEPKNVAIFLYQNVELLDFAGPGEVFSAAGFKTYTVSVDGKNLVSQGFVQITPEYAIDNAPEPDIIVFPGGNSGPTANDPKVIEWIQKLSTNGTQFMSVCTGAFILAKAGLLDNKRATTHWGSTKNLATTYPSTTVLENTRWIDNDMVITTAGVSAGIDGALHFVSRLKGLESAQQTARYMEYDKWNPENGLVDVQNEYLLSLLSSAKSTTNEIAKNVRAPYYGEFLNAANALIASENYERALKITEAAIRSYPQSGELYQVLGTANRKLGKPAPTPESELVAMVRNGQVDEVIAKFEKDKKTFPAWKIYSENGMKSAAYFLLLEKKNYEGAIKIFELNTREFPNSADTFDSLGEAYLAAGKRKEGIENYKIAASMGYDNAKKVLQGLGAE